MAGICSFRSVFFNVGEIAPQCSISCVVGAILWFTRFGGDFGFERDDFCRLKHTPMFNWFKKINICYFGIKAFHGRLTPCFVTKVIKHISDWSRISQTTATLFLKNASLHQISKTTELRLWRVGSEALLFTRRLQGNRFFYLKTLNFTLKFTHFHFIFTCQLPGL